MEALLLNYGCGTPLPKMWWFYKGILLWFHEHHGFRYVQIFLAWSAIEQSNIHVVGGSTMLSYSITMIEHSRLA